MALLEFTYIEIFWFILCGTVLSYVVKLTLITSRKPIVGRAKLIRLLMAALCIASVLKIFQTAPSSIPSHSPITETILEEVSTSQPICKCDNNLVKANVLIILTKPWRFFTSAHWFHICEYYLPHHASVAPYLHTNSTIFIMAPHDRFVSDLTRITYLLLMVAFTNGAPARVEVVPPSAVTRIGDNNYAIVQSISGSFIFNGLESDPYKRFSRSNGSQFPSYITDKDLDEAGGGEGLGSSSPKHCACTSIIGEFGAAPVERGFWFRSQDAVWKTRERLHRLCSTIPSKPPSKKDPFVYGTNRRYRNPNEDKQQDKDMKYWTKKIGSSIGLSYKDKENTRENIKENYRENIKENHNNGTSSLSLATSPHDYHHKLIIYQRNRDRMLLHHEDVQLELKKRLGTNWLIDIVMHDENSHPCRLLSMFRDSDVLLTPHGFQTMLLIFMPQGSAVYEIFPFKYWKDGYRPFANEYGMFHGWSQNIKSNDWSRNLALSFISQTACMQWGDCREYARRDDVILDESGINSIVLLAQRTTGNSSKLHKKSKKKKKKKRSMFRI